MKGNHSKLVHVILTPDDVFMLNTVANTSTEAKEALMGNSAIPWPMMEKIGYKCELVEIATRRKE